MILVSKMIEFECWNRGCNYEGNTYIWRKLEPQIKIMPTMDEKGKCDGFYTYITCPSCRETKYYYNKVSTS